MTEAFTAAEFEARVARLQRELAVAGADVMIVDQGELFAYLSGFSISDTRYRALFVPRRGNCWIVLRDLDIPPCRARSWIPEVLGFPDWEDPFPVMARVLGERGLAKAVVAIDDDSYGLTPARFARWSAVLPEARFVALTGVSDRLRQVKSASEITLLERAAVVADGAMEAVRLGVGPGITPRQARAAALEACVRLGADGGDIGPVTLASGDSGFLHGHLAEGALRSGDMLHVELTPKVEDYSARLMRPISVGVPTVEQRAVAAELVRIQDGQIAAMRPNRKAREIDAIVRRGLAAAGLRHSFEHITGYQLGLYARTPRVSDLSLCLHPRADWALEAGMVFHVYVAARGLAFSETVLVTPRGGRRLTRTPRCVLGTA